MGVYTVRAVRVLIRVTFSVKRHPIVKSRQGCCVPDLILANCVFQHLLSNKTWVAVDPQAFDVIPSFSRLRLLPLRVLG